MTFGDVTIGRLTLREANTAASEQATDGGGTTLSISGQESSPPLTKVELAATQDDIRGLAGLLVPVEFRDKSDRNGYYVVSGPSTELVNWQDEVITCAWSMSLVRVGSASEVDVEARLAGPQTRVNDHAVTGERWHAPPIGHSAYWSGATTPSTMTRTSSDGTITVYRGVPTLTSPRYACPVGSYMDGRVRVSDAGRERTGTKWNVSPGGWDLHNGLVRVTVTSGALSVASWTSGAWTAKGWDVLLDGVGLGAPDGATVLRNDPECVIVRLLWSLTVGRATCDLTLRRGSRFVELYVRTSTAATIKVARTASDAGTAATGYLRGTANDTDGNRYLVGSARTHTADVTGGISKASATSMDAFIGVELAGTAAVAGDTAADVFKQYCGSASEQTRGARR